MAEQHLEGIIKERVALGLGLGEGRGAWRLRPSLESVQQCAQRLGVVVRGEWHGARYAGYAGGRYVRHAGGWWCA